MNARQKAKYFKKLYERLLSKEPYIKSTYNSIPVKHYKIAQLINVHDQDYLSSDISLLRTYIENKVLHDLKPLIWNNLKIEEDLYPDVYRYSLDIWIE